MLRKALNGEALPNPNPEQRFQDGGAEPPEILFVMPRDGEQVNGDTLKVEGFVADAKQVTQIQVSVNGRVEAGPIQLDVSGKPILLDSRGKPILLDSRGKPILLDSRGKPILLDSRGKPILLDSRGKPILLDSRGKPILLDSRGKPILLDSRGKSITRPQNLYQHFECEVPLPPGEKQIIVSAVAYNGAKLAAREEVRLTRSVAAVKGTLYVLSVGVNRYQNPKYDLKYARQDAEAFARIWKGKAGSLYSSVQTTVLADDKATASGLKAALAKLGEQATEKDSVVIFMSGHGVQDGDNFYFATHEIEPTSKRIAETALPAEALQTALASIRARRVALFLDACHSGSALGGMQASSERLAELLVKQSGVMVYTSSRGFETSFELDAKMHGAFTEALLEGLGEGKANLVIDGRRSDSITAEDLLAYLRRRVPELSSNRQTPACPLLRDFGDAFPLAAAQ